MRKTYTVWNQTQNKAVLTSVKKADNPLFRLSGLMGKKSLPEGHGLWIVPCNSVHSCFMRFRFDAIFLDKEGRVLHLLEAMAPWRLSPLVRGGRVVLEAPAGTIQQTGLTLGDVLVLQPS